MSCVWRPLAWRTWEPEPRLSCSWPSLFSSGGQGSGTEPQADGSQGVRAPVMLLFWKESSSAQSQEHKHAPSPQSNLSGLGWRLWHPSTPQREAQGGWAADRGWPFSGQWPLNGCADWGLTMSPVRVWAGRAVESCCGARQMVFEIKFTYDLPLQREQLLGIQYLHTAVQPWSVSSGTFPSPRASPEPASGHHVPSPSPHQSARSHHGFTCSGCSTETQSHALCS